MFCSNNTVLNGSVQRELAMGRKRYQSIGIPISIQRQLVLAFICNLTLSIVLQRTGTGLGIYNFLPHTRTPVIQEGFINYC
jgi:hypothetical protein